MRPPAARASELPRSAIRVLFDAAEGRPDVLRLEVGEPSFTTPAHIIDAAADAAAAGHTRYGPNGGLVSLRELLVDKLLIFDRQAIGNQIKLEFPTKTVLYVSSEKFANQFIVALKNNAINDFVHFYQLIDVASLTIFHGKIKCPLS